MPTSLTEAEKEAIRYHLGYLETSFGGNQAGASLQYGIPQPIQTMFLVEEAIQNLLVNEFAVSRVRAILSHLDALEAKLKGAVCTLAAEKLGELTLHPGRSKGQYFTDLLEREYVRWANRLADVLGVPLYPYSSRFRRRGPGTNIPVRES